MRSLTSIIILLLAATLGGCMGDHATALLAAPFVLTVEAIGAPFRKEKPEAESSHAFHAVPDVDSQDQTVQPGVVGTDYENPSDQGR